MGTELVIDAGYAGYTFLGWARGERDAMEHEKDRGIEKVPYYNMFVVSPVSSFRSDTYEASGLKAEKIKCLSPVWEEAGLEFGDKCRLFFDKKNVCLMAAIQN